MLDSLPSPNKAGKARAAAHLRFTKKKPRAKRRSGSGVVFNFLRGAPEFFNRGELAVVSHAHPKSNLAIAQARTQCEGVDMQNSIRTAWSNISPL